MHIMYCYCMQLRLEGIRGLVVDWNGELYTFSGHLETPRTISGTVSAHGGIGRLRASKRG